MSMSLLDPGQVAKTVIDESTSSIKVNIVSGSITASNPSIGTTGSSAPTSATEIGAVSGGNLVALQANGSGALKTDSSAVTQPVSGTVTVNAGTNLNTSALALESGGNLAALNARTAGSLVPVKFDEVDLTYVPSGNGVGQIATAVYKLVGSTVKTLTLSYDGSNRLSSVVAS